MIHIYDGMAVLRRKFDTDYLGQGPRTVFTEMLALPKADVALWCFEGKGAKFVRQKILPGYKDRPSNLTTGVNSLIELTRDALKHTRAFQISVPGREADDVIAHLCDVYGKTTPVMVHTIDRDLLALQRDQVTVDVKPLKVVMDNSDHTKDVVIPPEQIRLYKTLCGDPSDRIPGMKAFGPKTYIACDPRHLMVAMQALLAGQPRVDLFVKAGVKEAMANRMVEDAAHLKACWDVVSFLQMPSDWEDGIKPGTENAHAGDQVLKGFMH